GGLFGNDRRVYLCVTAFTLPAAVLDLLKALPVGAQAVLPLGGLLEAAGRWLPLYGLGWAGSAPPWPAWRQGLSGGPPNADRHDKRLLHVPPCSSLCLFIPGRG